MKKSLSKILARMAKDGDVETVAEIIEEMMEPEAASPAEEVAEAVEETAEAVAAAAGAEEEAVVVETPEATIVVDEASLGELISRLDQIISLLTPAAPAADEDPVEEIAAAVEEALEAVAEEDPATGEEVLPEETTPEDVVEIVEEVLEPVVEDPAEDECGDPEQNVLSTGDALRTALRAVQPALAKMPKKQRQRVCADIAARLRKTNSRSGKDSVYSALASKSRKAAPAEMSDLGRRIMEKRNANFKK